AASVDMSGKSGASGHRCAVRRRAPPAFAPQIPFDIGSFAGLAAAGVTSARAPAHMCAKDAIDMTQAHNRDTTTPIATNDLPRIKLSPHGFAIDHPDAEAGERLMADAFGVTDRDAMHGILRQLVKASVNGGRPDEATLAFMISMMRSLKPRDA